MIGCINNNDIIQYRTNPTITYTFVFMHLCCRLVKLKALTGQKILNILLCGPHKKLYPKKGFNHIYCLQYLFNYSVSEDMTEK